MCGIAGLIHRGKSSNVGSELQGMLQALKHRGEDSTGYALYGDTDGKNFIMRFKVGENVGEGSSSVMEDVSVYDERKKIVDEYLSEMGAKIVKEAYLDKTDQSGRFVAVTVKFLRKLDKPISLIEIKKNKELSHLSLIKQSRLSVMPIDSKSWKILIKMSKI